MLLMDEWPFHREQEKQAKKMVRNGERPFLYTDVWNSTDPVVVTLKEAMFMCHEQDPVERASARAVETFLKAELEKLDPGRLDAWLQSAKGL